jgi:isochorismate pyruvate lyase
MDIETVRSNIDALDKQIVGLIAQRQGWVVEAGKLKTDHEGVRAPQRVEAVIAKVRALAADSGADPDVVERTYRAMIDAFIALELTVHDGQHQSPSPSSH